MAKRKPIVDPDSDDSLLAEMRERYDAECEYWKEIWEQGDRDMQALSVDGDWDKDALEDRVATKRPHEHIDIISQFNLRIKNQFRMRKRGFKFVQTGSNASDKTVELREARARQIQYDSGAFTARQTAFQSAVDRGIGHYKVTTERKNPMSMDISICIDRIPNSRSIVIDSRTRKSDRSDMRYAWHIDKHYTEMEFVEEFGEDAKIQSFSGKEMSQAPAWIKKNDILVAQYYRVHKTKTRLLQLEGMNKPVLETALHADAKVSKDERFVEHKDGTQVKILKAVKTETQKVMIYLTNGLEWLGKPTECVNTTIPIITFVGREKYIKDKLEIESNTRKMRTPQRSYDYAASAEMEDVGMSPKPKWLTELGSTEGLEEWNDANKNNYTQLRYRRMVEGLEAIKPERVDSSVDMTKYEIVKNSAMREAQNACGMTSADSKDRQSKSGVAQDKLDESADLASFDFTDNADIGVEYEGKLVNEAMAIVEDTSRTVGLRSKDDQFSTQQLDVKQNEHGNVVDHPYGSADDHSITVEVGPDFASQRDEMMDFFNKFMDSLKGTSLYEQVAYLLVQYQNGGPIFDKMVEQLKPANVKQEELAAKNGQPPVPPQIQQQMKAMQQHLQLAMEQLKKQAQIIDSKQIETNGKKDIAVAQAKYDAIVKLADLRLKRFQIEMSREIALIGAKAKVDTTTASIVSDQTIAGEEHSLDFDLNQLDHAQSKELVDIGQTHDENMAQQNMGHQSDMQSQQLDAQAEQAAQSNQGSEQ